MNTPSTEDARAANRVNAGVSLQHIDSLEASPDFAWFVTEILEKARDTEHDKALDVTKTPEEAERARWRHDALRTLCGELARRKKAHRETLGMNGA